MPLSLPDVTLICADTRTPALAAHAIKRCLEQVDFGHAVLLTDTGSLEVRGDLQGMQRVAIERMTGIADYSRLMIHGLTEYVQTSHLLVVQWDGFVDRPAYWTDQFLEYDYIGPPWYRKGHPCGVGNGGFSLRSARLLKALSVFEFDPAVPEDVAICVDFRPRLEDEMGIRFAPLDVAQRFGCEYGGYKPSFGFHGMHNFAHVLSDTALSTWLESAPPEILCSVHARKLVRELMITRRCELASQLITTRSRLLGWTVDQQMLWLRNLAQRAGMRTVRLV